MNKNITLINPFVLENFWNKHQDFKDIKTAKVLYDNFVKENIDTISSINEMMVCGNYTAIKEQYGYDIETKITNESYLGRKKKPITQNIDIDDGFEKDNKRQITTDDIESELTSRNIKIIPDNKNKINIDSDTYVVRNVGFDTKSMYDIHYCVQVIYDNLIDHKSNQRKITALSLLDTEEVEEYDALFAFMDIPNVDISNFNTSNGLNMEGMFYKSTFNNDSIREWNVNKVKNMRNTFVGCSMTNPDYINQWYPNTINHALPKLGVGITDDIDTDSIINKRFGNFDDIEKKYNKKSKTLNFESYHVMSSDEFILENKFTDYIKGSVEKVKSIFNAITIKLKNGMSWVFDKAGNMFNVITPDTTKACISKGINGVTTTNNWSPQPGYYDYIKKGSKEYNNYISFLNYSSNSMNESRVQMSANRSKAEGAAAPNIDVDNWNSDQLKNEIKKQVTLTQKNPNRAKSTLLVWGAPGIGKSSIPKSIIREMNNEQSRSSEKDKMTVLVADCSQMTSDGFSLPTPAKQLDISKLINSSEGAKLIAAENGISDEDVKSIEYKVSSDAPKTWLPVYKPTGDPDKDAILNALANGCVQPKYNKEGTKVVGYEKTGSGGILLIDEFLRSDSNVFFVVCQLMFEYRYGEYILGDKWQIIAASNRPSDDAEVRRKFASSAGAGFNRLRMCNFVPRFEDWKKWAESNGFDETTLSFIVSAPLDGEKSRWHNFDPELKNSQNSPLFVSPRSWSDAIKSLQEECEYSGYDNYGEIPKNVFRRLVGACLPGAISDEYTDYFYMNNNATNPYNYDNIIANDKLMINKNSRYSCENAANVVTTAVSLRYSDKHRIPVSEFVSVMKFFCNNYKNSSNVIYTKVYIPIMNVCNIIAPDNATEEEQKIENSYDEVGDIFEKTFPTFVENLED